MIYYDLLCQNLADEILRGGPLWPTPPLALKDTVNLKYASKEI